MSWSEVRHYAASHEQRFMAEFAIEYQGCRHSAVSFRPLTVLGFSTKQLTGRTPTAESRQPTLEYLLRVTQNRQRLTKFLAIVAAHRQLLAIDELHEVVPMRQWTKFLQAFDVDDRAAMNAYEVAGIELAFEFAHGRPHAMLLRPAVYVYVVCGGGEGIYVLNLLEENTISIAQGKPLQVLRVFLNWDVKTVRPRVSSPGQNHPASPHAHAELGSFDCLQKSVVLKRLDHVIGCVSIECARGKSVERAHENYRRNFSATRFGDLETMDVRQLHIHKQHVRRMQFDCSQGFAAGGAFADDLDGVIVSEDSRDRLTSGRLVIRNQRTESRVFERGGGVY